MRSTSLATPTAATCGTRTRITSSSPRSTNRFRCISRASPRRSSCRSTPSAWRSWPWSPMVSVALPEARRRVGWRSARSRGTSPRRYTAITLRTRWTNSASPGARIRRAAGPRGHSAKPPDGSAAGVHGDDADTMDCRVAARVSAPGGRQPLLPAPERRADAALARPDARAGPRRSGRVPPQRYAELTLLQRVVERLRGTGGGTDRHSHAAGVGQRRPVVQRRPHEARSRQSHSRAPPRDDAGENGLRGPAARRPRRRRDGQRYRAGGADVAEGSKLRRRV